MGRGESFFYKAFGNTEEEFLELLEMPETFILYRYFFEWIDTKGEMGTAHWKKSWISCKILCLRMIGLNYWTTFIITISQKKEIHILVLLKHRTFYLSIPTLGKIL